MFIQVINGCDTLFSQDHLWSDFTQEEIRQSLISGNRNVKTQKCKDDEIVSLVGKGKAKKGSKKGSKGEKKKNDFSKIHCFGCGQQGNHVFQFTNWKKRENKKGKNQTKTSIDIKVLSSRLEDEFALIACLSSSTSTGVQYIDSGASCHTTRVREYFSIYQEKEMGFQIYMWSKSKCTLFGRGTFRGTRESILV